MAVRLRDTFRKRLPRQQLPFKLGAVGGPTLVRMLALCWKTLQSLLSVQNVFLTMALKRATVSRLFQL